jgi:UDP-glucuronate 4-epimerase
MSPSALVTGAAGFIGSHVVDRLLREGWQVTAVDNFDDFYPRALKELNVREHLGHPAYRLVQLDIRNAQAMRERLGGAYDVIVHLAAKAGVRPSISDPVSYQEVNVQGTQNLLEFARARGIPQFVFASSSSVYGVNPRVPWSEDDAVLLPISPYASTKVSGELLGHVYSHLFGIRFVALRFFTVYGPRQRPDLAIRKFAQLMLDGQPLPFYGDGTARRDYTYIDDIVEGILGAVRYRGSPYEVINLGNSHAVTLSELVGALREVLQVPVRLRPMPMQPGDVPQTWARVDKARRLLGYEPQRSLPDGLERFASWFVGVHAGPPVVDGALVGTSAADTRSVEAMVAGGIPRSRLPARAMRDASPLVLHRDGRE